MKYSLGVFGVLTDTCVVILNGLVRLSSSYLCKCSDLNYELTIDEID